MYLDAMSADGGEEGFTNSLSGGIRKQESDSHKSRNYVIRQIISEKKEKNLSSV